MSPGDARRGQRLNFATTGAGSRRPSWAGCWSYFASQLLVDAIHMPPAFSQSAFVLKVDRSFPEGLAEGALLPLPEVEPGVFVLGMLPVEPLPPELPLPDGLLVPGVPLPPLPLPVWAAAKAGERATVPIRRANTNFFM
jgi:hypothetical protein